MNRGSWFVSIGLILMTIFGSAWASGKLPDRVPTHWNLKGEVDGYGPKMVDTVLMPVVLIGLLGLFAALPRISPAQFALDSFRATYGAIVVIALANLAFLHALVILAAMGQKVDFTRFTVAALLLGFGLMGSFFGKIRRNFLVGVRVPWTLASERVWNETHRLAAWVTCGGGLIGSAVALAGYPLIALCLILPIALIPIGFSLYRYKQLEARGEV